MTSRSTPKVSIIVTSYNIENYIAECLETIINQTLDDIEIIIVDDGSNDGTQTILKKYAKKDPRINLILLKENTIGGVATAANTGIEVATGEYIGFVDGDDLYDLTMFEKLYSTATLRKSDLVMCNYTLLDDKTGKTSQPADHKRWKKIKSEAFLDLTKENKETVLSFISVPWRKLYSRELIMDNNIRYPVGDYFFEDNPFHWFTTLKANRIALVPEALCQHRMFREGQTMATADRKLLKLFEHHQTIIEWLKSQNLYQDYETALLSWLTSQIEWVSNKIDEELREEFFDAASKEIKRYKPKILNPTLNMKRTGYKGRLKATMLMDGNKVGFLKSYDPEENFSLLHQAYLHQRLYGSKDLIRVIGEKTGIQRPKWTKGGRKAAQHEANINTINNKLDSIIVGIQILEQRIDKIDAENARENR